MIKHLSFWVGIFVAAIVTMPVAYGIISIAENRAADFASMIFGALTVFLVVLVLFLLFGDFLLKKLGLEVKNDLKGVLDSSSDLLTNLVDGDSKGSIESAKNLSNILVTWYSWSSLYRWVFQTCIALLVSFAAFSGTILIFEQIRKIEEQTDQLKLQGDSLSIQNELLSLSMTQEFRTQLSSGSRLTIPNSFLYDFPECESNKIITENVHILSEVSLENNPNPSVVSSLSKLTENEKIKGKVIDSLNSLVRDESGKVALGALKALEETGLESDDAEILIKNVFLKDMRLNGELNIVFEDSYLEGFTCDKCEILMVNSYGKNLNVEKLSSNSSWIDVENMNLPEFLKTLTKATWSVISFQEGFYLPAVDGKGEFHEAWFFFESHGRFQASSDGNYIYLTHPAECGQFPYPQICNLNSIVGCTLDKTTKSAAEKIKPL